VLNRHALSPEIYVHIHVEHYESLHMFTLRIRYWSLRIPGSLGLAIDLVGKLHSHRCASNILLNWDHRQPLSASHVPFPSR
jgi:hypothetical protein